MLDHTKAIIIDWWFDSEFNEYCALIEAEDKTLYFSICEKRG